MTTAIPAATYIDSTRAHVVQGIPVPSVTQILRATHVSSDFSHVDPVVLERKRQIGQAVHAATHYFDEGDLVESTVAPEARPYLLAWMKFRSERGFVPQLLETVVYSRTHHYIGRFDRLGQLLADRRRVLLDIKIGDPDASAADLQTAGYLAALREEHPEMQVDPIERWSVQLLEDGRYSLRQYPKRGRSNGVDRADFLALARAVNLRQERQGGPPCWM
jgi:hypothetical protein